MGFYSDSFNTILSQDPVAPSAVSPGGPLLLNLPKARAAMATKEQDVYTPVLQQGLSDPATVQAIRKLDDIRALRGQMPMSKEQTLNAIKAATPTAESPLGQAVADRPTHRGITDIPGNVVRDIRDVLTSIPKLPGEIIRNVQELPQLGERLAAAEKDPSKLSAVPFVGMIPGVYTLNNLTRDPGAIIEHPLQTALDVMPYLHAHILPAPASWVEEAARTGSELPMKPRSAYADIFPESVVSERTAKRLTGGGKGKANILDLAAATKYGEQLTAARDAARIKFRGTAIGNAAHEAFDKMVRTFGTQRAQVMRGLTDFVADPNSPVKNTLLGKQLSGYGDAVSLLQDFNKKYNLDWVKTNYGDLPAFKRRMSELTDVAEKRPAEITNLPQHEQEFLADSTAIADDLMNKQTAYGPDSPPATYGAVDVTLTDGRTHTTPMPYKTASDIWRLQEQQHMHEDFLWLEDAVKDPSKYTPQEILDHADQSAALNSGAIKASNKINLITGYVHALNVRGYDARPFLSEIRKMKFGQLPTEAIDLLRNLDQMQGVVPITLDEIRDTMRYEDKGGTMRYKQSRHLPQPLVELRGMLKLRSYTPEALTDLKAKLNNVHTQAITGKLDNVPEPFMGLDIDKANSTIDILRRRQGWLDAETTRYWRNPNFSRAEGSWHTLVRNTPDPRLVPLIQEQAHGRMVDLAARVTAAMNEADTPPPIDLVDAVRGGETHVLEPYLGVINEGRSMQRLWSDYTREAKRSWQDLAATFKPDDMPRFIHHVPVAGEKGADIAKVTLGAKRPPATKTRSMDLTPYSRDLMLATNANVMEHLIQKGDSYLLDILKNGDPEQGWMPVITDQRTLLAKMAPLIEKEKAKMLEEHPSAADVDLYRRASEKVLKRTHSMVDIDKYRQLELGEPGRAYKTGLHDTAAYHPNKLDQQWMPRNLAGALDQYLKPTKVRAVWDPFMSTFRTSALILSPRWQVYNTLGNLFLGTMSSGYKFWTELPKARENLNAIRRGEEASALPANIRTSLGGRNMEEAAMTARGSEGWADTAALAGDPGKSAYTFLHNTLGPAFNNVKNYSIKMNAYMDDLTRISVYLAEESKAVKGLNAGKNAFMEDYARSLASKTGGTMPDFRQMTRVQAENAMLEATYNWDQMTPWERSTARNIFPFYGFYSHILRYASRYAFDHPFRMAIFAGFARNELNDWGTGLPDRIHNYFLLNRDRNDKGEVLGINMAGWSPFANTADLFTLSGWVNQVNPLISTLAQQLGVDPRTGEASTYPATAFDPQTGRLELQAPNIAQSALQAFIPQVAGISALTGIGADQELKRTNPDAYAASIRSAFGIPSLYRQINVPQEIANTENAALNAAQQAQAQMYRTGQAPPQYPRLAELQGQIEQLQGQNPAAVAPYTPPNTSPAILDLVKRAVIPGG